MNQHCPNKVEPLAESETLLGGVEHLDAGGTSALRKHDPEPKTYRYSPMDQPPPDEVFVLSILFKCTEVTETVTHWSWVMTPVMSSGKKDHPNYKYDRGYFMSKVSEFRHAIPKGGFEWPVPKVGKLYRVAISQEGEPATAMEI